MATIGFAALLILLGSILSGYMFECGVASIAIGALLLVFMIISKKLRGRTVLFYLSGALLFSGIVLSSNMIYGYEAAQDYTGKNVDVVATLTGKTISNDSGVVYILKTVTLNGDKVSTKMRLSSNASIGAYAGDTIAFSSKVYDLSDYDKGLRISYLSQGIYLNSYIYQSDENVDIIKDGSKTLTCKLQLMRDTIKTRIYSLLPNENGAIAIAMLLGDSSAISDKTISAFSLTGVSHLFAISGLHLSIWVMGLYYLLDKIGFNKRINSTITILFTLFFMLLTGFTESISRAGIMLIVMALGNLLQRGADSVNSLGVAAFIILMFNPFAAANASFLLSFSATLGILVLFKPINIVFIKHTMRIKYKALRRALNALLSVFSISLCASIATLPVSAFVFGSVSLISPIVNVFISHAATLLMVTGGFAAIFFPFSAISRACALISGLLSKYVVAVTSWFSRLPLNAIKTDSIFFIAAVILCVIGIICCVLLISKKSAILKSCVAVVICACLLSGSSFLIYSHNLTQVTVVNVGDGLSMVVKKGFQQIILGCGGSDKYKSKNIQAVSSQKPDLMIVPDTKRWNAECTEGLLSSLNFDRIISGEKNNELESLFKDYIVSSSFRLNPWENASIEFFKTQSITYAYCIFEGTDILVIFDCDNNAKLPDKHLDADFLICSYYLPYESDVSGFENIVISSSDEIANDVGNYFIQSNKNIYSTFGKQNVDIDIRKENKTKIYYD